MSALLPGQGIVKGLAETARNFVGSYFTKDRLTTVQYPEERVPQKEAARNFPFLVYDGGDWQKGLRCVACLICEKECPPQCIYIVKDTARKPDYTGKLQFQPKVFDIDTSVCMSCQICVEVCPFDAIKMDVEYELSTADRSARCWCAKRSWQSPTSISTRSTRLRLPKWMRGSALKKPRPRRKPRLHPPGLKRHSATNPPACFLILPT